MRRLRTTWARLPVLPVLRTETAAASVSAAERLLDLGVAALELTATTPGWEDALRAVRRDHPGVILGLGTVRSPDDAHRAAEAGADFLVSPHLVPDVRRDAPLPLIEGGATPTELAAAASEGGADGVVKLFPAHVGGPAQLRSLRTVLPEVDVVPTGGIEPGDVAAWLDAGALAVGLGTSLTGWLDEDPARAGDWLASIGDAS